MNRRAGQQQWLYHAYDAADRLLYIGQTKDPEVRMRSWETQSRTQNPARRAEAIWFRYARRFTWRPYASLAEVDRSESAAVRVEQPPFNTRLRGRPAVEVHAERELFAATLTGDAA